MPSELKSINVRLSPSQYESLKLVAEARGSSLNRAVEDSIESMAAGVRKENLRKAFERIAVAEHSVEYGFEAQSEVVLAREE